MAKHQAQYDSGTKLFFSTEDRDLKEEIAKTCPASKALQQPKLNPKQ